MANLKTEIRSNDANNASAPKVDMKFELVVIPVSDVDRAKEFYARLGWRLDADFPGGDDFRVVQFTPPGSGGSIIFGNSVTGAAPGSAQGLYLIVPDIEAARAELLGRGVEISEVFHDAGTVHGGKDEPYLFGQVRLSGRDPEHRSYRSFASFRDPDGNGWLFQEITTRLPGRVRLARNFIRLRKRPGKCTSACGGRPRQAREAYRRGRSELARLVRQVHGGRTVRRRPAAMNNVRRNK
jgi:catechol 2,3-dioxygenase-like lactoylglutathione lyase family enzyme